MGLSEVDPGQLVFAVRSIASTLLKVEREPRLIWGRVDSGAGTGPCTARGLSILPR